MTSSPLRFLALAMASVLMFSAAAPAEAAKKKSQRPTATQSRTAKPKARGSRPPARPAPRPARAPLPVTQDKATRLNRLYDEYWDASMRLNPLQATFQGDPRFNDQLPNFLSPASRRQAHEFMVE